MTKPSKLKIGDTIGIAAPAGNIEKDNILKAMVILEKWGLNIKVSPHLFDRHYMFSSEDKNRLNDYQELLDDKNVKAIFAARGGYGTNRIIDSLDFSAFIKSPKWIIGFSDITLLHNHINSNFDLPTIHSCMPSSFGTTSEAALQSLYNILFNGKIEYTFPSTKYNKTGKLEGEIIGGNLAIICSAIGTDSQINTDGKILLIEDVGENHYKIDRMLWQLKRSGLLKNLKGLLVGAFNNMEDTEERFGKNVSEIIIDITKEYDFPIAFDLPIGHIQDNHALLFNTKSEIEILENKTKISTFYKTE